MTGRIYNKAPEGYTEFDALMRILSVRHGAIELFETSHADGYVYVHCADKTTVKLDYVYVSSSTFEGNVYAVMCEVSQ